MFKNIAVYGGGSFGTALAVQVLRCCDNVTLFLRDTEIAKEITDRRTNDKYLGDVILPHNLIATTNLDSIGNYEMIIVAMPSRAFDDAVQVLKICNIPQTTCLLIATKGFARNPTELLSTRVKSLLPNNPVAFIAGPNLAKELIQGLLTPATIAASNVGLARKIAIALATKNFITSVSNDIVTLQVAGAIKNIIAIKSGLNKAKSFGENARALLITDALKEIQILSKQLGGVQHDISCLIEYGVVGDLILTCYSPVSRNTEFGYRFGISQNKEKFLYEYPKLVEGVDAVKLILDFIKRYKISLPIITSVASELGVIK